MSGQRTKLSRRQMLSGTVATAAVAGMGMGRTNATDPGFGVKGDGSTIILGGSQGQRANEVLIPEVRKARGTSLVVHDPSGTIEHLTAESRKNNGPVWRFDWRKRNGPSFNCLDPVWVPAQPDQREVYFEGVAKAIVEWGIGGRHDYFSAKAQRLMNALAGVMVAAPQGTSPSLPMIGRWVGRMASADDGLSTFTADLGERAKAAGITGAQHELEALGAMTQAERRGVMRTLDDALQTVRMVEARIEQNGLSPADLHGDTAATVYVRSPREASDPYGGLGTIMASELARRTLETRDSDHTKAVMFMMDGKHLLNKASIIASVGELGRGRRVTLIASLGTLGSDDPKHVRMLASTCATRNVGGPQPPMAA